MNNAQNQPYEEFVDAKEIAKMLNVSVKTVLNNHNKKKNNPGPIPAHSISRYIKFLKSEVFEYAKRDLLGSREPEDVKEKLLEINRSQKSRRGRPLTKIYQMLGN